LLLHRELNVIRTIGEGEVELLEQEVPGHWVGRSAGQVSVPGEIDVVAIMRRGRAHLAAPASVFERADRAVIAIVAGARTRLEHLLGLR
jgi:Trk K+ transport system NAD-binding subunit